MLTPLQMEIVREGLRPGAAAVPYQDLPDRGPDRQVGHDEMGRHRPCPDHEHETGVMARQVVGARGAVARGLAQGQCRAVDHRQRTPVPAVEQGIDALHRGQARAVVLVVGKDRDQLDADGVLALPGRQHQEHRVRAAVELLVHVDAVGIVDVLQMEGLQALDQAGIVEQAMDLVAGHHAHGRFLQGSERIGPPSYPWHQHDQTTAP